MILKKLDELIHNDKYSKAGYEAEKQMEFYLHRTFTRDELILVLNGIRLKQNNDVCQIDHLVIHEYGMVIIRSTLSFFENKDVESMDTDYLTEKAYEILILEADKVLDYLRSDIGASAREYSDEDSYLRGIFELLTEIAEDPIDYLESWSLEEEIDCDDFHKGILDLQAKVEKVINMPLKERGKPEFE